MAEESWSLGTQGVRVQEWRGRGYQVLRTYGADRRRLAQFGAALGCDWPFDANTQSGIDPAILWLSPGEYALIGELGPLAQIAAADIWAGELFELSDIGEGRVAFRIDGSAAYDLLATGCSLDLHPRSFGPQACAQTLFLHAPILLRPLPEATGFEVWVDAPLAHYLRDALVWSAETLGR